VETNHSQFKCDFVINTNQIKIKLHCFTCQKALRLNILCVQMYLYYSRHSRCTSINLTNKNITIYRRFEIKIVIIIILFPSNIIFEGTHGHIDIYAKLTQNFVIRGVYKPSKSVRHFRIIDSLLTRFIK